MRTYKLDWKGILYHSVAWLYLQPGTLEFLILFLMIILYIPSLFLSYLKVSSDGLELRYWPLYKQLITWDEIDRIGKCRALIIFPSDALYLKREGVRERNASIREWGLAKKVLYPSVIFMRGLQESCWQT